MRTCSPPAHGIPCCTSSNLLQCARSSCSNRLFFLGGCPTVHVVVRSTAALGRVLREGKISRACKPSHIHRTFCSKFRSYETLKTNGRVQRRGSRICRPNFDGRLSKILSSPRESIILRSKRCLKLRSRPLQFIQLYQRCHFNAFPFQNGGIGCMNMQVNLLIRDKV